MIGSDYEKRTPVAQNLRVIPLNMIGSDFEKRTPVAQNLRVIRIFKMLLKSPQKQTAAADSTSRLELVVESLRK